MSSQEGVSENKLGRLTRVDVRRAWKNEASDFTPWLAKSENLQILGDTIGLNLECEAQEKDVVRMKERMRNEAKAEADKIISEAQLGKEKIREELVREMDGKSVEFAGELFRLVISETVTDKMNIAFIDELIAALEEVDATSIHVDASETEFTTSHPMDPTQRERLEKLLNEKFGVDIKIEEKVDASLLAGIAIKLGSLEIDGSLLNRYKEGVAEVTKNV